MGIAKTKYEDVLMAQVEEIDEFGFVDIDLEEDEQVLALGGPTYTKVSISKAQIHNQVNKIQGDNNEYLCRRYLESKGAIVLKLAVHLGYSYTYNPEVLMMMPEMLGLLHKYHIKGMPDFICKYGDQYFFVECKANPDHLNDNQRERIPELIQDGWPVFLWCGKPKELRNNNDAVIFQLHTQEDGLQNNSFVNLFEDCSTIEAEE